MGGLVLSGEKGAQISRQLLLTNVVDTTGMNKGAFTNLYHLIYLIVGGYEY